MPWEEEFLIATAVFDGKGRHKRRLRSGCLGCGCLMSFIPIVGILLTIVLFLIVI